MPPTDLIVVGAGSVGCVVAMRLARDFGLRVTLCETPSSEPSSEAAKRADRQRPARWLRLLGSPEDYQLVTQPTAALAGRSIVWPRGRGLGGSSRINAMIWHEPTAADGEALSQASGGAIGVDTLQAAVREIEKLVQPESPRWLSPAAEAFMSVMTACSDGHLDRPSVYRRFNRQGQRWTAQRLLEIDRRDSIEVVRGVVDHLLWRGDRAVGVRMLVDGKLVDRLSERGVILCAGSIATPTILIRSGIGPRESLDDLGLPRRVVCEAVGQNLQDHLVMPVIFATKPNWAFSDSPSTRDLCRWEVNGSGPLASNIAECGGIFAGGEFQLHVTPTHYLKFPQTTSDVAMTIAVNATRPRSRGRISCISTDPHVPPEIETGYLSDSKDLEDLVRGIEFVREVASKFACTHELGRELIPGKNRGDRASLSKAISRYSQTLYHPVGTCAMGMDDRGVIQQDFCVPGCERLWIADGSILPVITQGNPSVTLMSLGWIAAEAVARMV